MLINLNAPIVNNKIISSKHLGYKGLHLIEESASYPTDSLDYKYSEAKITNPKANIYSCLEQSSTDNISFSLTNQR